MQMDPILILAVVLVLICGLLFMFLWKRPSKEPDGEEPEQVPVQPPRRQANVAGGRRVRQRMAVRRQQDSGDEEDGEDDLFGDIAQPDEKIGAKKMRKLQDKADRKAQREAELQEREERKQREAALEEQRRKEERKQQAVDDAKEAEEQIRKEEQERQEHEEYLKLKEAFVVEEEGTQEAELDQDTESLLQQFIDYIQEMKVIMLEDLAAHFKIKTQDAIDRVNSLQEEGRLSGVMDDRGKFIYITRDEYEAVAKFMRQRGRVSIAELAESSNQLINLNPENQETHRKLVGEAACS